MDRSAIRNKTVILSIAVAAFFSGALYGAAIDFYTITGRIKDGSGNQLPYRVMPPKNFNPNNTTVKYPLILSLHGAPGRCTDNTSQIGGGESATWAIDSERTARPCFVVAPQCPTTMMWVSVPWENVPAPLPAPTWVTTLALSVIDTMKAKYPIDTNRIYCVGGSMGGVGATYFPEFRPNVFAASVAVAAGGDSTSAVVSKVMFMGWWLFHGAIDNTIPVAGSRTFVLVARRLLKAAGKDTSNIKYTEYPNNGHDIWDQSFYNLPMHQWLFQQNRANQSTRIHGSIFRPTLLNSNSASGMQLLFPLQSVAIFQMSGDAAPSIYTIAGRKIAPEGGQWEKQLVSAR